MYHTATMISAELLSILCCPETRQELMIANASLIDKLNQRIKKRELKTRGGESVTQKIEGGLLRADKKFLYTICDDIPVLLTEDAIPLAGLL